MSMPWGETKALWPISAYHMTLPFPLWSTGICFLTLLAFYLLCDVGGISIPTFNSVSMNALFIYIVQCVISETEAPKDIITSCYGWIQRPLTESAPSLATPTWHRRNSAVLRNAGRTRICAAPEEDLHQGMSADRVHAANKCVCRDWPETGTSYHMRFRFLSCSRVSIEHTARGSGMHGFPEERLCRVR